MTEASTGWQFEALKRPFDHQWSEKENALSLTLVLKDLPRSASRYPKHLRELSKTLELRYDDQRMTMKSTRHRSRAQRFPALHLKISYWTVELRQCCQHPRGYYNSVLYAIWTLKIHQSVLKVSWIWCCEAYVTCNWNYNVICFRRK